MKNRAEAVRWRRRRSFFLRLRTSREFLPLAERCVNNIQGVRKDFVYSKWSTQKGSPNTNLWRILPEHYNLRTKWLWHVMNLSQMFLFCSREIGHCNVALYKKKSSPICFAKKVNQLHRRKAMIEDSMAIPATSFFLLRTFGSQRTWSLRKPCFHSVPFFFFICRNQFILLIQDGRSFSLLKKRRP